MNKSVNNIWTKSFIVLAVIFLLAFVGFKYYRNSTSTTKPNYANYVVKKGNIRVQVLSTGVIQPENKVEIKPPIPGRVEKVLVSEGQVVRKGQVLAWMSSTERAAMLDAASSKGAKEFQEWAEMYRATPIVAAINGMIIQKNVESGQTFTTADAVLVMSDRLTVKAQVDETDIGKIKLKQKARILLDAYPEDRIEAIVDQIAYDAKTVNNVTTYIVDVLPKSAPIYMRSGMTANVTFDVEVRNDILVVPADAINTKEGKSFVSVAQVGDKEKVIEKEIMVGLSDGKKSEVIKGLIEGESILVQEFRIKDKKSSGGSPFSPGGGGGRGSRGGH